MNQIKKHSTLQKDLFLFYKYETPSLNAVLDMKNKKEKKKLKIIVSCTNVSIMVSLQYRVWGSSIATIQNYFKQIAFRFLIKIKCFVVTTIVVATSSGSTSV